jgi:hypothetical protein
LSMCKHDGFQCGMCDNIFFLMVSTIWSNPQLFTYL